MKGEEKAETHTELARPMDPSIDQIDQLASFLACLFVFLARRLTADAFHFRPRKSDRREYLARKRSALPVSGCRSAFGDHLPPPGSSVRAISTLLPVFISSCTTAISTLLPVGGGIYICHSLVNLILNCNSRCYNAEK